MSQPSSQVASIWVQQRLDSTKWILLKEVLYGVVRQQWLAISDEEVWEYVESNLGFVAEHLRNMVADCDLDGAISVLEIDNDPSPYVRLSGSLSSDVVSKLRRINPFELEEVCAKLLTSLGASSNTTQRTNDGGVDFVAVKWKIVPTTLTLPVACTAAVIGQAKRYKDGNSISETRLREFVGAATLRRYMLGLENKIGPLAPVLYAFWTTSDFDENAKRYARTLGLWYMDGPTLAKYVVELGLKDTVMSLPDDSSR
jgi:hypothetical protein